MAARRRIPGTDLLAQPEGYSSGERGIYTADGKRLGVAVKYQHRGLRPRWQARNWVVGEVDDCSTLAEAALALQRHAERLPE